MRRLKLWCYVILGILLMVTALETALRFLPVTRGLFRTTQGELWPLHAFTPRARYTYSMTWDFKNRQVGVTNNYGHLAPFDFAKNSRPVIVLGDSFIEAQMLAYSDTLQAQLARHIGSTIPVYGLGVSGNSIAEHLALAALAKREFQPRAAVILLNDSDFSDSIGRRSNHYFFEIKQGQPTLNYQWSEGVSLARKIREPIGDSALYRYVFSNLRFSAGDLVKWMEPEPATSGPLSSPDTIPENLLAVMGEFLRKFPLTSGVSPQCTIFLLDSDRKSIYRSDSGTALGQQSILQQRFSSDAQQRGYRVIDMKPRFLAHYRMHRQRFDFFPIDAHWNWLGHKLAAEAAFEALRQSPDCL